MNERIARLRKESFETRPSISIERALLTTEFYLENGGKYSVPVTRALNFRNLCEKKEIYIGPDDLIVAERGPRPKSVSTFPELNCHSAEDLEILNSRPMTNYAVDPKDIDVYREKVIPYWRGRSMRDRAFAQIPREWMDLYEAGCFTEFMEQRAPGHTVMGGQIYRLGMEDFQAKIAEAQTKLDWLNDPHANERNEELKAMSISCDAAILFARRHAELAEKMAASETNPVRKAELEKIASVCRWVPAHAPRDFWEALQMYWFVHLGTITELNGWDAMSPGHLDQHLAPFYEKGVAEGTLDREKAKELLSCFWIKVNNTPAPPKVGVTAAESGTYNDFTQINLGGLKRDGSDGTSEVSYLVLEVLDELQLLQPQVSVQISGRTPERFLKAAGKVIRRGSGYPSVFNADMVIQEQVRVGKTPEDAREGGTSGCVETGCFGREAYLLHGYLNTPKILELTLHNGVDPLTGKQVGLRTGDLASFRDFEDLYAAFVKQLNHVVDVKIRNDNFLQRMFAAYAPAPFLSVLVEGCIENGRDYYDGGPKYNSDYIQCCGIGTITDSLSVLKKHVFEDRKVALADLVKACDDNWQGHEELRQFVWNKTPFFGNDDDYADSLMQRVYASLFEAIDGKHSPKGPTYHLNMLSTTCHVYFGKKLGATPNGRFALLPESDGTSPSHGADRHGPTAVVKSLGKMDQVKSGGTLLNQRFLPSVLAGEEGIEKLAQLIRTYFRMGGHHIQFNVVDSATLRDAQKSPDQYRDLLVRVAGYSDYFVDLDQYHQEEIIARTAQEEF
ncbi:Formate C-acetyltransferase [Aminomonas paucivorans DSM 12260]|uniref:Formate C-acetyltransferase n=1 Tax=Aminomonas paucivorans DSM 12260 TaxID=584708 RepID=E3CV25_9BACT|nr:trans-4-hydroxy-L-proline dehydratase [Aminomonas paucivorans]EFQ23182.1 Formate C-acetyltransferase [Aminomonas paucivorans DSM 12260]